MNIFYNEYNEVCEIFASPFNNYFSNFCSLFTIDKKFGSLDNFFNLNFLEFNVY
jgi:hypothetical protein